MNYNGDQGQTIRQLLSAHMIRRVAMCCLSSPHGKRQHLGKFLEGPLLSPDHELLIDFIFPCSCFPRKGQNHGAAAQRSAQASWFAETEIDSHPTGLRANSVYGFVSHWKSVEWRLFSRLRPQGIVRKLYDASVIYLGECSFLLSGKGHRTLSH